MSIEIKQVNVLDNPSGFTSPFKFEITFDCLSPGIIHELEWKLIYVGSADNDDCDQELDSVLVGPVKVGKNRFIFQVILFYLFYLFYIIISRAFNCPFDCAFDSAFD